jgi:hypothetical protein
VSCRVPRRHTSALASARGGGHLLRVAAAPGWNIRLE